jgi:AraC-like DNA-binding protein
MAKFFVENTQDGTDECVNTKSFTVFYSNKEEQIKNMHIHDCCEVLLCLTDKRKFLIGDEVVAANKNDIMVVNQFEIHKLIEENEEFCERYVFKIHPQFILFHSTEKTDLSACFYDRKLAKRKAGLTDSQAAELIELWKSFKNTNGIGDDILAEINAVKSLVLINRYLLKSHAKSDHISYTNNSLVHSIIQYINQNLLDEINLDEISKKHYISKNHLCRIFKKHTGTTVISYIITRRIAEAKKFLSDGCDVKDTCEKCGFNDYSHFIRTFKNIVGVPPKQYINKKN